VLKQDKFPSFSFSHKGSGFRAFMLFFCLSATTSLASAVTVICKNEKSVRTLRVDKNSAGCRAIYTKQGVDQVVGSSTRDNGCDIIVDGIRKTLEGSVWKCRDVKEAVVSNLSE
jgi:hypothetical protein